MLFRRRHAPSLTSSDASSAASDDSVLSPDALGYDSSDSDYYDDDERRIRERRRREQLQQEWEEGMEQLQLIFVVVLMPWVGKFWGRKFAHTPHNDTPPLPNELFYIILSFVDDKKDLLNLCLACQGFHAIAQRRIYTSLNVGLPLSQSQLEDKWPLERRNHFKLYLTLQVPGVFNLVAELRIELPLCGPHAPMPERIGIPTILVPWSRRGCLCNALDHHLGRALQRLTNLRVLHVSCFLCPDPSDNRHLHLMDMRTEKLKELTFFCRCSPLNSVKTLKVLSSPPVNHVENLEWNLSWTMPLSSPNPPPPLNNANNNNNIITINTPSLDTISVPRLMEGFEFLPNLKTLKYDRNSCLDYILSMRPVMALGCRNWNRFLHNAIRQHGSSLVHLRMSEKWYQIQIFIQEDPTPYQNLRHIGVFSFMMDQADRIVLHLKPFEGLPHLSSLEVINHMTDYAASRFGLKDPWNTELLARLHIQHPSLKKVFIRGMLEPGSKLGFAYWIWEISEPPRLSDSQLYYPFYSHSYPSYNSSTWTRRDSSFQDWTTMIKEYTRTVN